jgi:hypothetical protein
MTEVGFDPDGVAQTELDHFGNCPVCGALIDMRDLGQILAHMHDAEIEISKGRSRRATSSGHNTDC